MGRPLNKKYFGNTNTAGVGGEGVTSVTAPAGTLASLVNGTYAIPAASITAPQIAGGTKPTLNVVVTGTTTYTVAVVTAGTGYTTAPTITFNGSVAGGSGSATPVATLTTTVGDAIVCQAITSGSTNRTSGNDILKQVSILVRLFDVPFQMKKANIARNVFKYRIKTCLKKLMCKM